jgi:hypothetical protein
MQIINCTNQTFELDYILYTPSFDTLSSKPTTTTSASKPATTTSVSLSSSQTAQAGPSISVNTSTSKSTPVGATVGGVVGGIVCLLLISFMLYRKKLASRRKPSDQVVEIGTCLHHT